MFQEPSKTRQARAFGQKVFRGEYLGEKEIHCCYKADWRLVPKAEETALFANKVQRPPKPEVSNEMELPPLMHKLMCNEALLRGDDPQSTVPRTIPRKINLHYTKPKLENPFALGSQ